MADPVPMIPCPSCKGTGEYPVLSAKDGKPVILPVACGVCKGSGQLPLMGRYGIPDTKKKEDKPPPPPAEMWPILIPVGIFVLFFLFLRT